MKALITGGAGFIGSHLAEALLGRGIAVTILDNLRTGKRENLAHLDVDFIEGDITEFNVVSEAMGDCEIVFHQAALVSVPQSIERPELNHAINVNGAQNVFEAARQHRVKRVVYASSAAVYGNEAAVPTPISASIKPISPYASAKFTNEITAQTYNRVYGTEFIGLRYFNVYGPRQDPKSPYSGILSICCDRAANGKPITIFGDGEQTRDFIYATDVAQANLLASQIDFDSQASVFNVGTGDRVSLNQVLDLFQNMSPQPLEISYDAPRPGDIRDSGADISQTKEVLGFKPHHPLKDGLEKTFAWYRQSNQA